MNPRTLSQEAYIKALEARITNLEIALMSICGIMEDVEPLQKDVSYMLGEWFDASSTIGSFTDIRFKTIEDI